MTIPVYTHPKKTRTQRHVKSRQRIRMHLFWTIFIVFGAVPCFVLFVNLLSFEHSNNNLLSAADFSSISHHLDYPWLPIPVPVEEVEPSSRGLHAQDENTPEDEDEAPYYLTGRTWNTTVEFDESRTFRSINNSPIRSIKKHQTGWVLPKHLQMATRNHDSFLLEFEPSGRQMLFLVLGRYSRTIQRIDLLTGQQKSHRVEGIDPAGNPLNDLNHVYSVLVDSLNSSSKEVWLPCGFHGDRVNKEESSHYARILDLTTMEVKVGPKLPFAGGACVATPIHVEGADAPPHICSFGGTQGNHDTGNFLPYTACFDRQRNKWHYPFGKLPFGFDHGSLANIPPGVCQPSDPARVLIFNFRTSNYGTPSPVMLAFDLPQKWTQKELDERDNETPGEWYVYANISYAGPDDEVNASRDASGVSLANSGKNIINFGGVHYDYEMVDNGQGGTRKGQRTRHIFSTIRSFDVCTKKWTKIGSLGAQTFAIQSSASRRLNTAFSCGGHAFSMRNKNIPWCFVSRIPGVIFDNDPGSTVLDTTTFGASFFDDVIGN